MSNARKRLGRRLGPYPRAMLLACLLFAPPAASVGHAEPGEFTPSVNDFGSTGLLQMPNARFQPDGEFNLGISYVEPYTRGYFTVQGLPWLEGTFRYTDIGNRRYSPFEDFSGDQNFKDRSVDLKIRLIEESALFPQVAMQIRDIGGTGLFGSEYIVASRRYYGWDFSLGLAWGNGGSRGHMTNPLSIVSDKFKTRASGSGPGGIGLNFFRGERVALFGGIEYATPVNGLRLKLEYDGNSYQREPLRNRFDVDFPLNAGIEYDVLSWLRLAAAYERGNTVMLRGSIRSNMNTGKGVSKIDDPPPPKRPRRMRPVAITPQTYREHMNSGVVQATRIGSGADIGKHRAALRRYGLHVTGITVTDNKAIVRLSVAAERPEQDALANAALATTRAYRNSTIDRVEFVVTENGHDLLSTAYNRADLERSVSLTGSPVALAPSPPERWFALFRGDSTAPVPQFAQNGEPSTASPETKDRLAENVFAEIKAQGFRGEYFWISGGRATLHFSHGKYRNPAKAIGRAVRAMLRHVPADIVEFAVAITENGVPVTQTVLLRKDLENALQQTGSPEEMWQRARIEPAPYPDPNSAIYNNGRHPTLAWSIAPQMRHQIGGPDAFWFFQLYGRALAEVQLSRGLSATGMLGVNVYNNFDDLKLRSDSKLPRVRSDIANYLHEGEQWIDQLHMDYIARLAPSLYGRASAGIFELMYTGVGGELMYREPDSRWALGLDLNYVWQRDFNGGFSLRDYEILTGHVSYYHRLPFHELLATLRLGKYLAGDIGATLELSRTFENGVTVGAFATKTDVSAEQFGEGSFDKGFFVSVPLDLFFSSSSRRYTGITFRPVTRDGGQRLAIPKPLYVTTSRSSTERISAGWEDILE